MEGIPVSPPGLGEYGLGGFRLLKKTLEAPYTTKVNYRDPTSRGTTLRLHHHALRLCIGFSRRLYSTVACVS